MTQLADMVAHKNHDDCFQSGTRYYIKAEVRTDSVQYLVQTQFGKLPKCPRIHIFPYLIKALSPVDELAAICG